MKKINLTILALIFGLFLVGLTSAATNANVTILTPIASSTMTGTFAYNCTLPALYTTENYTTVLVYMRSASLTANTTWTLMSTRPNNTAISFNGTVVTTILEDANDYEFNCTLWNGTDKVNALRTGLTIDNTIPQVPTLSPSTNTLVTSTGTQTFTGTVTDRNTTSCTYTIYRGGNPSDGDSGSASYSGSSCTFTKSFGSSNPTGDNGNWYWTITASDESNTTSSTTNILQVQVAPVGGSLQVAQEIASGGKPLSVSGITGGKTSAILWVIGIIVAIVVIVVIARRIRK